MPPHVLVDFVVLPSGHGRSVTDFWGWDAHEAQLRCSDDVRGDIGGCSARRTLKPKFYQPTQTMVTAGILPFGENSHGRAGNRARFLMISSQRLWPLDHEAGRIMYYIPSIHNNISVQWYYICSQVTLRQRVSTANCHLQANIEHWIPLSTHFIVPKMFSIGLKMTVYGRNILP